MLCSSGQGKKQERLSVSLPLCLRNKIIFFNLKTECFILSMAVSITHVIRLLRSYFLGGKTTDSGTCCTVGFCFFSWDLLTIVKNTEYHSPH